MNLKITYSILALVFAMLACRRAEVLLPTATIPAPTATAPASVEPSTVPEFKDPGVWAVLWSFAYSSDMTQAHSMTGVFPYTHLPSDANILVASLGLKLPSGWPEHKTELRTQWFLNGVPVEGAQGSLVCSQQEPCKITTNWRFSSGGLGAGRHELRLYLGSQLLEGMTAEVQLVSTEWVGDLFVLRCDDVMAELCNKADDPFGLFSKHAVFPAGTQMVKVVNAYAMLPSGAGWQVELYRDDRLIASEMQAVDGEGHWSGCRVTALPAPGGAFEPGLYFVKLLWKGVVLETVSFEVQ